MYKKVIIRNIRSQSNTVRRDSSVTAFHFFFFFFFNYNDVIQMSYMRYMPYS